MNSSNSFPSLSEFESEDSYDKATVEHIEPHIEHHTHVLMLDSRDRDQTVFPSPTQVTLKLPRQYRKIERLDIVQIKFRNGLYALSAARGNTTVWVAEAGDPFPVTIPDGTYTVSAICAELTGALCAASVTALAYNVTFSATTGRISVSASGPFQLLFKSALQSALPSALQTANVEWGLGWNLGWNPMDTGFGTSFTANYLPRLHDEYVFLRLNETAHMNDVDHTELDVTALTQESSGQVAHYFGKLLLPPFGGWSSTLIEAPKVFRPPLGRLERLTIEWLDRWGRILSGADALSCDWHMTVRIVEEVEVAH